MEQANLRAPFRPADHNKAWKIVVDWTIATANAISRGDAHVFAGAAPLSATKTLIVQFPAGASRGRVDDVLAAIRTYGGKHMPGVFDHVSTASRLPGEPPRAIEVVRVADNHVEPLSGAIRKAGGDMRLDIALYGDA